MKRNCTLDLRFHPSSGYTLSHNSMNEPLNIETQLRAILHNRRHTFDITEFQVRMIIWLASQEKEERNRGTGPAPTTLPSSLQLHALLMNLPQGISIKRSIQNFLQKRKKRSQSQSHQHCNSHSSNIN